MLMKEVFLRMMLLVDGEQLCGQFRILFIGTCNMVASLLFIPTSERRVSH